jgi:hypothetical protein
MRWARTTNSRWCTTSARVRLIIHQRAAREWDCSIEELLKFGEEARSRAISVVRTRSSMHGKVDQASGNARSSTRSRTRRTARSASAMSTCPSMQRTVQSTVARGLRGSRRDQPDGALPRDLPHRRAVTCMTAVPVIEDWCKAVRAEVERKLLAGENVPGFKLVLGKAGARAWKDPDTVEASLKAMRLKVEEMYDLKLISPTSAEKLAKAKVLGPRQWTKLQPLIGRSDPKPSVAPLSDKRDAYVPPPTRPTISNPRPKRRTSPDFPPRLERTHHEMSDPRRPSVLPGPVRGDHRQRARKALIPRAAARARNRR